MPVTSPSAAPAVPRVQLTGVSKQFGGAQALKDASVEVGRGEVHGLLGENGSGKSTLIKALAGYHTPDAGQLVVDGSPVRMPATAGQLKDLGISFVHQDLGLIDSVTVTENVVMRDIATRRGLFMSWRQAHRDATALLRSYGLEVDGRGPMSDLTAFQKAMVAIIRALEGISAARSAGRGLLVLDEAMAFLADHERELLTAIARDLAAGGTSVLLVTHDLDDALKVCDRITVLRDGRAAGTVEAAGTSRGQLAELILGASPPEHAPGRSSTQLTEPATTLSELSAPGIAPVSLTLGAGEIVGLTGLAGESFARIPYIVYGAEAGAGGTLALRGQSHAIRDLTPPRALDAGIVLVPGDRQRQSAVGSLSVAENVALPLLDQHFAGGRLRTGQLRSAVRALLSQYQVRPAAPALPMTALSGGNQQKAIIAKWLQLEPQLLLLDEPTIGVDVGSRAQIFRQIRHLAAAGTTVLCASSDYSQLAELCDRILIFSDGRLQGELAGQSLTKEMILSECLALSGASHSLEP
jgi:ribose transport system ATP-binding protein